MISHDLISFSGVHIYDLLYIHLHYLSVWLENERFIYVADMRSHNDSELLELPATSPNL